jgi:5-methylcytosine-specific restriction endonuclease McrA
MNKGLRDKIIQLRAKGKTYNQIMQILDCTKGTISYHLNESVNQAAKEKVRSRRIKAREGQLSEDAQVGHTLSQKKEDFCRNPVLKRRFRDDNSVGYLSVTNDELKKRFGAEPTCYLTGRKIDLSDPKTYQFDHIIPASKGGESVMTNLGLASPDANYAKGRLMLDEFIQLCKEVLEHNGYTIQASVV